MILKSIPVPLKYVTVKTPTATAGSLPQTLTKTVTVSPCARMTAMITILLFIPGPLNFVTALTTTAITSIPINERDLDGDGYRTCGIPADCNDNDRFINPGAQEWCSDNKDNNCNSQIDETPCICPDADSDGFTASYCGGTDCSDTDNTVYPGAPELCTDGKDNDCNGLKDCADPNAVNCPAITDADGDGFDVAGICGTPDCDDNDANVYPGAPEICDGKDSNCDGWKAPTDVDADKDGVPVCAGDCNDSNPNISPLYSKDISEILFAATALTMTATDGPTQQTAAVLQAAAIQRQVRRTLPISLPC